MKILFKTLVEVDPKNITCRNIETGEEKKLYEIELEYCSDEDANVLPFPWTLPEAEIKDVISNRQIVYCDYDFEN